LTRFEVFFLDPSNVMTTSEVCFVPLWNGMMIQLSDSPNKGGDDSIKFHQLLAIDWHRTMADRGQTESHFVSKVTSLT